MTPSAAARRGSITPIAAIAALLAALMLPACAAAETPQPAAYLGQWYLSFPEVCTGAAEETDGLLTYTAREFIGLENRCRIVRTTPRGSAADLAMRCLGEGHPYRTHEVVRVVDGRLHRTVFFDGRRETYTYERCPARAAPPAGSGTSISPKSQ